VPREANSVPFKTHARFRPNAPTAVTVRDCTPDTLGAARFESRAAMPKWPGSRPVVVPDACVRRAYREMHRSPIRCILAL
jgi:hypothetical protein